MPQLFYAIYLMNLHKLKLISLVKYLLAILVFLQAFQAFAMHQRAGEITYRHISGLTYEVTITTYTFAPSAADRCELTINWGDGESSVLSRSNGVGGITPAGIYCEHTGENISQEIRLNIYKGVHTYASSSTYKLWLEDPNRNLGIQNIPNSVDVPLYIETLLVVNPFLGSNSSPVLLLPPIDNGCVGIPYLHNPGAFDPNGDSLAYKLVSCKGAGGLDILGYKLPSEVDAQNPGSFTINEITGDIIWDSPTRQGEYNFAFIIEEYRSGVRIGYVTRDMQVNITSCNNNPPVITVVTDTCVIAGSTLNLFVEASDADNDNITLTADGGPLILPVSPATFEETGDSLGHISNTLVWNTVCAHVRKQPYQIYFKAIDDGSPVRLFDLETVNISVIAPPVTNPTATPLGNSMVLNWDTHVCPEAEGYRIYRRAGTSEFIPGPCETGVPPESGFSLIRETSGVDITNFTDDNNGIGLVRGIMYCYIVTAWFEDGAESIASEEFCASLKKDLPVITNVSINSTSTDNGSIYVAWSKPTELDYLQTPGPFIYRLSRSQGFSAAVKELITEFNSLDDTTYTDTGRNTQDTAWTYSIEFINNTPGNVFSIGFAVPASSVFITTTPSDKQMNIGIRTVVPWVNREYTIYRKNPVTLLFDSIASTVLPAYIDTGLVNDQEYCYLVRATGTYGTPGYIDPIINNSQESCETPLDNVAPCPPELLVEVNCDERKLSFAWNDLSLSCAPDVRRYYLYLKGNPHTLISSFDSPVTSFVYEPPQTIAGCFFIVADDVNGNTDTTNYNQVCVSIDNCPRYSLPNVFTPNNDTYNDFFTPYPGYTSVERIDIQIFNRWGVLVYETSDPKINWDGKDKSSKMDCADGVYFYTCDVYEVIGSPETPEEKRVQKRTLIDSIHLLR
ncbi:MAG: gliding motility-associated C-terminal domain-containing protein [Bacteroidales bacterium]|nr:gliding motility-associated C-terminal domain-containing protein [Bacteroidales bacterium]